MMEKRISVYTNEDTININEDIEGARPKYVPCLLTVELQAVSCGYEVTIRGRVNPLPFKKAIIKQNGTTIDAWLEDNGWEEIKRDYVSV